MSAPEEAARYLAFARRFRALGDCKECVEYAAACHHLAVEAGDAEHAYRARACVGIMYFYRNEFGQAYEFFRAALREVEAGGLQEWLGPAHSDCWAAGEAAGFSPGDTNDHAAETVDGWRRPPRRLWMWLANHARQRWHEGAENARYLWSTTISASWHTVHCGDPDDEYARYRAKMDRMMVYSSAVLATGALGYAPQWQRSLNLFDQAAEELGTYEGYAHALLDVAEGTHRLGGQETLAASLLSRCAGVAARRNETEIVRTVERMRCAWEKPDEESGR